MKIKEQDFKNIPQKKEFVAVLKKLNSLPEGGNPHPYFEEIMLLLSGHLAQYIVPTIYPYLVAFAVERSDFAFFNFVINLKIGFYTRVDLSLLTQQEIREYLGGMFHLQASLGLVPTEEDLNMDDEFKSLYLWNAMMLYSASPDVLVISRQGRFSKPFKVKCPHCENDVHSLCINVDNMEHTSNITPAADEEPLTKLYFFDDIFGVFKGICDAFQEKYFSKVLTYVYGTYECGQCKKTSRVIDAMKNYQFHEDPPFIPTDEFLEHMLNIVVNDAAMHPTEQWMMTQFVVSGYRAMEGMNSLKALRALLYVRSEKHNILGPDGDGYALEGAEKILSINQEKTFTRGEILAYLIDLLKKEIGNDEKITEYYQEIIALYSTLFGGENEKTIGACLQEKLHLASMNPEKEVGILTEYYESLNKVTQNESMDLLARHLSHFCAKKGNFQEAVAWKEKELTHKEKKYESNSLEHGVFLTELGYMYQKVGNLVEGERIFLQSIDLIHAGLLEKYHLPDTFFQGKLKKNGTHSNSLYLDANGFCVAYNFLGDLYTEKKDHKKALECYENGMKLREWITDFKGLEIARSYLKQANGWKELGDKKKGKALAEKAVKLYEIRVKQEKDEMLLELSQNGLIEGKEFLELLK